MQPSWAAGRLCRARSSLRHRPAHSRRLLCSLAGRLRRAPRLLQRLAAASSIFSNVHAWFSSPADTLDVRDKAAVAERIKGSVSSKQYGYEDLLAPIIAGGPTHDWTAGSSTDAAVLANVHVGPLEREISSPCQPGVDAQPAATLHASCLLARALACVPACVQHSLAWGPCFRAAAEACIDVVPKNPNNFNVDNVRVVKINGEGREGGT